MRPYRGLTKEGKWVYGWDVGIVGKSFIVKKAATLLHTLHPVPYVRLIEVIPESIGQFTGLKDKNGKEDYDGNIWEVEYRGKKHRFSHRSELSWEGYIFSFKCLTGEVSPVHANVEENGIIIGNIHQPEEQDNA